ARGVGWAPGLKWKALVPSGLLWNRAESGEEILLELLTFRVREMFPGTVQWDGDVAALTQWAGTLMLNFPVF
ncbi:MAG: hypothetical protein WCA37_16180, partial [Terracidiphilus sp.]